MSVTMRTTGIEETTRRLSRDIVRVGGDLCYQGLIRAAVLILADAMRNAPRDTGNLMGSGYLIGHKRPTEVSTPKSANTSKAQNAKEKAAIESNVSASKMDITFTKAPSVIIGFGASYAMFVHEGDPNKDWHDGGPQFLLKSLLANGDEAVKRVADSVSKMRLMS